MSDRTVQQETGTKLDCRQSASTKARRPRASKKSAFASLCSTLKLGRTAGGSRRKSNNGHGPIVQPKLGKPKAQACSLRFILSTNGKDYTYLGNGPQLGVNRMTKEQWDDIALKPLNPFFQFRTCAKNKDRFAGMQRQECRIVELFADEWNRMSPEEQLPYEQMAAAARFEFKLLEQSVVIVDQEEDSLVKSSLLNPPVSASERCCTDEFVDFGSSMVRTNATPGPSWVTAQYPFDDMDPGVLNERGSVPLYYECSFPSLSPTTDSLDPYADSSLMFRNNVV